FAQIHVGSQGGKQALVFDPPSLNATKGSVITFVFDGIPGNHTVAQSAFGKPCEPLAGGFDSGYIFVPPTTEASASFPTFNITIEDDTKPIWFYCAQQNPKPHCVAGMVGAINAPATGNTYSSFAALA
ncbi:Cupredoxin, partial [Trametes polyzona]